MRTKCEDCHATDKRRDLLIVMADEGSGAYLAVLCEVCSHRRGYRARLRLRRAELLAAGAQHLQARVNRRQKIQPSINAGDTE